MPDVLATDWSGVDIESKFYDRAVSNYELPTPKSRVPMFGAYILGRSWVCPATIGAQNRRQGYVRGLQQLGWLSLSTFPLFIVGAIWEAFSLGYLVPPLIQWLL